MKKTHHPFIKLPIFILIVTMTLFLMPIYSFADVGSYSINWKAADLELYSTKYPSELTSRWGRTSSPLALADYSTAVESLEPRDSNLGQIIAFEMKIDVGDSTSPENGVIQISNFWDTVTTSNDNYGYAPVYGLYAAFVDTSDSELVDPKNNASVAVVDRGLNDDTIESTIEVSGLDSDDEIIVELWVVLKSIVSSNASGNVQSYVIGANIGTIANNSTRINVGKQTIPLYPQKNVVNPDPTATLTKTAGVDSILENGGPVTYTLTLTNTGLEAIQLTGISDTQVAGILLSDITWADGFNPATDWILSTDSVSGTYVRTYSDAEAVANVSINNTATITFKDDDTGTGSAQGSDSVAVTAIEANPDPTAMLTKTAGVDFILENGGPVTYTLTLTNTGLEAIQLTGISDTQVAGILLSDITWADGFNPATDWILSTDSVSGTYVRTYSDAEAVANVSINNTATITFKDDDTGTGSAQGSDSVAVTAIVDDDGDDDADGGGGTTTTLVIEPANFLEVHAGEIPQTGDTSNAPFAAGCLLFLLFSGLGLYGWFRKEQKESES